MLNTFFSLYETCIFEFWNVIIFWTPITDLLLTKKKVYVFLERKCIVSLLFVYDYNVCMPEYLRAEVNKTILTTN